MSTYAAIHGTVTLSPRAWGALSALTSSEWLGPHEAAEGIEVTHHADGSVKVHLNGETYRNLCGHLPNDLASAQTEGDVAGELTIDCSDGSNWRSVLSYRGRKLVAGEGECFHQTVHAREVQVTPLGMLLRSPGGLPGGPGELLGSIRILVPVDGGETETLPGAASTSWCGCGGWDEEADQPSCPNRPVKVTGPSGLRKQEEQALWEE